MARKRIDSVIEQDKIAKEFSFMETNLDKIAKMINSMPAIRSLLESADSLNKLREGQDKLKGSSDELSKINKQIEDSEKKLIALRSDEAKKLAEVKVQQQEVNKANKEAAKDVLGLTSAYDKFKKSVTEAQNEAKNLQLQATTDPSKQVEADAAVQKAKELSERLREIDQKTGDFRSNVGNYANSLASGFAKVSDEIAKLKTRNSEIQSELKKIEGFKVGGQVDPNTIAQFNALNKELKENDRAQQLLNKTAQIGFQTQGSLNQQVRQSERAYQEMARSGVVANDFLDDFRKFVASSKDELLDLRGEIKALSSDTFVFDQIASVVQTLTGAFQVGASVATLFGASEQDVQKNIQKLLVIQNVANGVQQIANQLTLRGSVLNKAYAFTQGLLATALNASASAAVRFEASLGFIGIAAAAIGGIALAIYELGKNTEETSSQTKFLSQSMEDVNGEYSKAVQQVTSLKINLELAKQGFVDKKSVVKEYNETIGKTAGEVKNLDEVEKEITKNAGAYVEATLLKAAANLALEEAAKKTIEIERNTQKELVKEVFDGSQARIEAIKKAQADPEYKKLLEESETAFFKSGTNDKQTEAQRKEAKKQLQISKEKFDEAKKIEERYFSESINGTLINERKKDEEIATGLLKRLGELRAKFNFKDPSDNDDKQKERDKKFYDGKLKLEKEAFERISSNEDAFIADRIAARKKVADLESRIVFGQTAVEIENAKGNTEKIKEIREKESDDLTNIIVKRNIDILKLQSDFYKELAKNSDEGAKVLVEAQKQVFEQQVDEATKAFNVDKLDIETFYQREQELNEAAFQQGRKSEEDYARDKKKIQSDLHKALLDSEIKYTETIIKLKKLQGADTTQDERDLLELKKGIREDDVKDYEEFAKKLSDLNKKIVDDHKSALDQLRNQLQETFLTVFSGIFDGQINKIHEQIDAIEQLKAADINRINASTESEEKKAARITVIEAKAQVDREALERRQRKIEHDKAVFERAFKAFQITTTGIESVAKIKAANIEINTMLIRAIASGNPALIALATSAKALAASQIPLSIGTTAAQLVALFATPIPKFKKGTTSSPAGLAEVAEEGPELAIEPKGSVKLFEKHSLQNLMKGTKIFPANITKNILATAEIQRTELLQSFNKNVNITVQDNRDLLQTTVTELKQLNKKPSQRIVIINQGNIESTPYYQQQMKG